jgi:hypothetical protein
MDTESVMAKLVESSVAMETEGLVAKLVESSVAMETESLMASWLRVRLPWSGGHVGWLLWGSVVESEHGNVGC